MSHVICDVEVALLTADLEKEMCVEMPEESVMLGHVTEDKREQFMCQLTKAMCRNIDSPLCFFKKKQNVLHKLGLTQSPTDPCLFFRSMRTT